MRILFVRHGESEANLRRVFSNRGWQHPLTETGRGQARTLARTLEGRGVTALYTSPLRRAVETAEILGASLGLGPIVETGLTEYDVGDLEGRDDPAAWRAYEALEAEWADGRRDARLPGGESLSEVRSRFTGTLCRLTEAHAREGEVLLLVGHGGTYRHGLPAVLGNVAADFAREHGLGHADVVEAESRDGVLTCLRWGADHP